MLLAACAALVLPVSSAAATPPKAPAPADQVIAYYDGGGFKTDAAAAFAKARTAIDRGLKTVPKGRRGALVMDIDDTALSTYACEKPVGFGAAQLAGCVLAGKLPALRPALDLARHAQARKVKLVFITGRPEGIRALTEANLKAAGYRAWLKLVMRPATNVDKTLVPYKSAARKTLEKHGLRVLVNVGDQQSDLTGGAARVAVKVPNPMYFTP